MDINELEAVGLQTLQFFSENRFLGTCLLIVFALAVKRLIVKQIRKRSSLKGEDRRHQINTFKQLYNASVLLIIMVIWSSEIQSFAFSIAAFMVAIVLATKEFIQCFLGFIYYVGARPFRVGDWVQLNNQLMGEVVEIDWAKTSMLEVNPDTFEYTGKHIYVPNSHLVTQTVKNLNFLRRYSMHTFTITLEPEVNVFKYMDELEELALEHCSHFREVAERYKGLIERHMDVEFIDIDPCITVNTNELAKLVVSVSLFCPTMEAYSIEYKITADLMNMIFEEIERKKDKPAAPVLAATNDPS